MWSMSTRQKRPILRADGESLGQRIRRLRKARGLTQSELGDQLGISMRAVCSYERDECEPPAHILVPLSEVLACDIAELMGTEGKETNGSDPLQRRWVKKMREVQSLPERQQRAIMQVLDMALQKG